MPDFICIAEITSSAIAIKRNVKENVRTAVLLMLAYCNRGWLFFLVYYHASYQFLKVRERSFAAILQVRSSSMFLLILIIGKENVLRSDTLKSFNVHTPFHQNRSSGRNQTPHTHTHTHTENMVLTMVHFPIWKGKWANNARTDVLLAECM